MIGKGHQVEVEVAVVGCGPAGLTAAIALAGAGVATALIGPRPPPDQRTTALLADSVRALTMLGVWPLCRHEAAPLRVLRIIDDTRGLVRAPVVSFAAAEIGLDAFGYNIENRHLVAALQTHTRALSALVLIEDTAQVVAPHAHKIIVRLQDGGRVTARLVIGADGRDSLCRAAAGIAVDGYRYPQAALTLNLQHTRPHFDTANEFHADGGPFTLVPLPGNRSSLVCVIDPAESTRLSQLDDVALAEELERRAHSILGRFALGAGRAVFPLALATARRFGANRIALVGESAHLIPPIGAQGLNLGLRDAAAISELVTAAHDAGGDVGDDALLARYHVQRSADIKSRAFAVDLLNRTLLSGFLPLHGLRGLGLFLIDHIAPLRRALMREGIAPTLFEPRLMRGISLKDRP